MRITRRWIASMIMAIIFVGLNNPVVSADLGEQEFKAFNQQAVENYLLPLYMNLREVSNGLSEKIETHCREDRPLKDLEITHEFNQVMDAWSKVQHTRFGPIELFLRFHRFYAWPEAQRRLVKSIREFLMNNDKTHLEPDRFKNTSTAIQGLLALEYLYYADKVEVEALFKDSEITGCDFLTAISNNVKLIADGVVQDWVNEPINYTEVILNPSEDSSYYVEHREGTLEFFKSLHLGLQVILDLKLKPVLGKSIDGAKPYLAEFALSDRSIPNIMANLESLQDLNKRFASLIEEKELRLLLDKAFRATHHTSTTINLPLQLAVVDSVERKKLEKLMLQVRALKQIVKTDMSKALGFSIGFNALDGD